MQADQTSNADATNPIGPIPARLQHERTMLDGHTICLHTCAGSDCTREHECDVNDCSQLGKSVNEWRRLGGNWAKHMRAYTKHPKCDPTCPRYDDMQKDKERRKEEQEAKKREKEKKAKRKARDTEDVEMASGGEGVSASGITAVRKRGRIALIDGDDDDDANDSGPAPSASASQIGTTMDVDMASVADQPRTTKSVDKNTDVVAKPARDLRFNVVVVLDVNGRSEHRNITNDTSWAKVEVKTEDADEMVKDAGLLHFVELCDTSNDDDEEEPEKGHVIVWMYDRVSESLTMCVVFELMKCMQLIFANQLKKHGSFDITYLPWEQLRDGLLESDDFANQLASKYSLLFGGPDIALDLR